MPGLFMPGLLMPGLLMRGLLLRGLLMQCVGQALFQFGMISPEKTGRDALPCSASPALDKARPFFSAHCIHCVQDDVTQDVSMASSAIGNLWSQPLDPAAQYNWGSITMPGFDWSQSDIIARGTCAALIVAGLVALAPTHNDIVTC